MGDDRARTTDDRVRGPAADARFRRGGPGSETIAVRSRSPRPHEPDLHVRFRYGTVSFDYLACRTAVENLLEHWTRSHNPGLTVGVVADGLAQPTRLPCESIWLTR